MSKHAHHHEILVVPDGGAPVVLPADLDFEAETAPPRVPLEGLDALPQFAEVVLPVNFPRNVQHVDLRFLASNIF